METINDDDDEDWIDPPDEEAEHGNPILLFVSFLWTFLDPKFLALQSYFANWEEPLGDLTQNPTPGQTIVELGYI